MRGHLPIIEMRQSGHRPKIVFINDYPCKTDWREHGDNATVCVSGDRLAKLDLRYLVGLRVSITSADESRARDLFDLAKQAGAMTVAAGVVQPSRPTWDQTGWFEVWHQEKSNG